MQICVICGQSRSSYHPLDDVFHRFIEPDFPHLAYEQPYDNNQNSYPFAESQYFIQNKPGKNGRKYRNQIHKHIGTGNPDFSNSSCK